MNGYEKAAVFLWALGEEVAANICKELDKRDIGKLSMYMTRLKKINGYEIQTVLEEVNKHISQGNIYIKGEDYLKNVLTKGLGNEDASAILKKGIEEGTFDSLRWIDSHTLSSFLIPEHPQTIAVVLSLIEPGQAAEVMAILPDSLRTDVAIRIAKTERISSEAIEHLENVIKEQLDINQGKRTKIEGIKTIAEILNHSTKSIEDVMLDQISNHNNELANSIKEFMFTFENIAQLDERGIQILLTKINTKELSLALKTATKELKEKIFKSLSQRACQILRDEMEINGPVRVVEVEKAQQKIIKIARKLAEEGMISINRKEGGETFV
jgi:flagellar motor switch protein FliG